MRKYNIKRELAYHEGAYSAITEIISEIDQLICQSCHYRENDKLWQLRDKVYKLYDKANDNIRECRKDLNERN